MVRIGTVSRLGPTQVRATRRDPIPDTDESPEPAQALVLIDGGRAEGQSTGRPAARAAAGKPRAGFIAQLLTADDPSLLPSRLTRTQMAAARYAEAARRLA